MNKVFEKILEWLEELRETYDEMAFIEMNTNGHTLDFEYAKGKKDVMLDVKKIVQEVAEEYNGGWIPCDNELPNTREWHDSVVAKEFLVTYYPDEVTKPWVGIRLFRKGTNDFLTKKRENVIAWQSLPAPYNTKGE